MARLAAVEGGGTTFVVAIASDPTTVLERAEFPTTTPKETLRKCCEWLASRHYDALGVACFGPLDLKPDSPTFGYITTTPKPGWQQTNVLGPLKAVRPAAPTLFDTDVNAPAVAEFEHMVAEARARGVAPPTSCCYITVGTGIGVGLVINEKPVHGMMHPEGGHMCVPRRAADAGFESPIRTIRLAGYAPRTWGAPSRSPSAALSSACTRSRT
jgi:fructokinase